MINMTERQKQIIELTNDLERAYLSIKALGGKMVVTRGGEGEDIELGELRRGNAVTHTALCLTNDFVVLF